MINKSTVSQEYFKILRHSQSLPNIQARKLLKHKFLGCSFNGPSSALDKSFQRAHGPAIWVSEMPCVQNDIKLQARKCQQYRPMRSPTQEIQDAKICPVVSFEIDVRATATLGPGEAWTDRNPCKAYMHI